jgi:hypothetical protein
MKELGVFFDLFDGYALDILQVRPIQQLGNTAYTNFSWEAISEHYDSVIGRLHESCSGNRITFIAPSKSDLVKVGSTQGGVFWLDPRFFTYLPGRVGKVILTSIEAPTSRVPAGHIGAGDYCQKYFRAKGQWIRQ